MRRSKEPPNTFVLTPKDGGPSFPLRNRLTRALWNSVWLLAAAWTPTRLQPWRRYLLCLFGAQMGRRADVRRTARVWLPSNLVMADHAVIGPGVKCYNQGVISLGEHALVSQDAHLCAGTHDIENDQFVLLTRPIHIGAYAWVAAEAFVGPGARIGDGAVVGARAVVFGELEPWAVYAGNPAKKLSSRRWRPKI